MFIKLKRAYDVPSKSDGKRILVERLWPRGLSKERAALDDWLKDLAPSPKLRTWYGHDPAKWPEFQKRYAKELVANEEEVNHLRRLCGTGAVTFIFAAKDEKRNSAVVLKKHIENLA